MDLKTSFGFNHPSILNEITKSCEKLITESQNELKIFKNEQQQFKQQILEIVEENNLINSKLEGLKEATFSTTIESKDDATIEQLANETYSNVMKQIGYLQRDNDDLHKLNEVSKNTIQNLEKEIENYRIQLFSPASINEVKKKYKAAILCLESTIESLENKLKNKNQTIKNLMDRKTHLLDRIEELKSSFNENDKNLKKMSAAEETIAKLQDQIKELTKQNKDLQEMVKLSKQSVEDRFRREQSALQKVQEALSVAEAAVACKEEAMKRENIVKEEYKNIASTIGQVMDEAASKVEKNMKAMKKEFRDKEQAMLEEREKIDNELQNQKKRNDVLETRCNRLTQKYKEVVQSNEELTHKLNVSEHTNYELEKKFSIQENLAKNSEHVVDFEIKQFMESNQQLKDRYRMTLNDMTKTFEETIYRLQNEVDNLKSENGALKSGRSCGKTEQ